MGAVSAASADEVVTSDDGSTIDDVVSTASEDEIITIDGSDDAIIGDGDYESNVEKTFTDLESDLQTSTDVKLVSNYKYGQTSDIANYENTNAYESAQTTYDYGDAYSAATLEIDSKQGTFIDLDGKIIDAIVNHDGVLNLTYDFAFDEDVDEVFQEGIKIGGTSSLTINGNNHTISGSELSCIFNIDAENVVTFNNIRFENAYSGAIFNIGSKLVINNCTFINNNNYYDGAPDEGGAISTTDGDLVIADCVFINNSGADGGAIFAETDTVTVNNCEFTNNTATGDGVDSGTGGAIHAGTSTLTVNNCVFTNNTASTNSASSDYVPHGGAINTVGRVIITNSNFTDNSADEGGALKIQNVGEGSATLTTIDNCIFINNTAREGAAIYNYNATLNITDSQFKENVAREHGALYSNLESITNIQSCTFNDSIIYIAKDSELSLFNNTISSTKAEIVSDGKITSTINVIVLGNTTVPARIGDEVTLTAKVTDDKGNLIKDGNFTLVVDGVKIDTAYNDTSNLYQANYAVKNAGSKIVNMTYLTTDNLVTYIGILDVPKNNATLIVTTGEGNVFTFGENITVFISLYDNETLATLTENVTVTIYDTEVTVEVINGAASFNVTGFEPGQYDIIGIFNGTVNYNRTSTEATIIVTPAPSKVVIDDIANVVYNSSVEVTYTVVNETSVTVVVKDSYGNEITNGVNTTTAGKVIISGLNAGKYTINITNAGEGNYSESSDEAIFNVSKATITINPEVTGNLVPNDDVNVTFTVPIDIDGMLSVTIDDEPVLAFVIINGICTIPGTYKNGTHTVVVTLTDDTNYEDATGQTTFDISKVPFTLDVTIKAPDSAGEETNVTATVPEDATGQVLVYVDDGFITSVPINKGIIKSHIYGFNEGGHNLTITYDGDDKYYNATYFTKFFIGIAPTNTTINVTIDGFDVEITVNVNSWIIVNGGNVTLTFNNQNSTKKVVDGVAVYKFTDLDAATYPVAAYYSGNYKFLSSNATSSAKIVKKSAYLKPVYKPFIFNYGQLYRFRLVDKNGNGIGGRTVEFSLHGKVYYVTTDNNGWGKIQLTPKMLLQAGKIYAHLIFRGDRQYKSSIYAIWVNAMKESAKYADVKPLKSSYKISEKNKQITATLKDSRGKVIAGKQVSITIKGKTIKVKTNSKGMARFTLDGVPFKAAGKTAFILIFEDVNYKRTTFKSVINIVKD